MRFGKFFNMVKVVLFVLVINLGLVASAFPDVSSTDVNSTAINFLRDNGIVEGYPDGSFGPDLQIVRAELVKIVVESSGLSLSGRDDCFPDIERGSWYANYVCTAFENGIIEGYPDGTFKPARNINRVEAIKIFLEAEGLELVTPKQSFADQDVSQWYAKYVTTAFELNYLPFVGALQPDALVKRREFAEMYYRLMTSRENQGRVFVDSGTYEGYYEVLQLDGVVLTTFVPKKVLVDEVYFFEGRVEKAGRNLQLTNLGENNQINLGEVGENFSIPIWFGSRGIYNLKVADRSFQIQVVENVSELNQAKGQIDLLQNLQSRIYYDDLVLNYGLSDGDLMLKFEFVFADESFVVLNRQGLASMVISLDWLRDVWSDESEVKLNFLASWFDDDLWEMGAYQSLDSLNFKVVESFEIITNNIYDEALDFSYGLGDRILVEFMTDLGVDDSLFVIKENGLVEILEDKVAVNGKRVKVDYVPNVLEDFQIIEVNDVFGQALINYPIYRSNVLPLRPDPYEVFAEMEVSIGNALMLINQDRLRFGLQPLKIDMDLQKLAQAHVDDMVVNDYVAHADLSGRKVSERKKDFGIKTFVGENIARNFGLVRAHNSLMRSAAHRINILDENWTDVGIGFVVKDGVLWFVQNFSFDSDIVVDELVDWIADLYNLQSAADLMMVASDWSDLMVEREEFGAVLGGQRLMDKVANLDVYVSGNSLTGMSNFVNEIQELIVKNQGALKVTNYKYFGFDVKLGDNGVLYFVLIITS